VLLCYVRHVPTGWKREREDLAMGYERLGLLAMRLFEFVTCIVTCWLGEETTAGCWNRGWDMKWNETSGLVQELPACWLLEGELAGRMNPGLMLDAWCLASWNGWLAPINATSGTPAVHLTPTRRTYLLERLLPIEIDRDCLLTLIRTRRDVITHRTQ